MTSPASEWLVIHCVYFKSTGKYYASGSDRYDPSIFKDCIYPKQYGRRLLNLEMLPGLEKGTWDGPFIVNIGTYPELVLPVED